MRSGSSKILALVLGGVAVLGLICGGGVFVVQSAAKRLAERRAERESAKSFFDAASKAGADQPIASGLTFPNTPKGRMMKAMYQWMQDNQKISNAFSASLDAIGWDRIGTPELLESKASLDEALVIVEKAEKLTDKLEADANAALERVSTALEQESKGGGKEERELFAGFTRAKQDQQGTLATTRKTIEVLHQNHNGLTEQLQFLKKRVGHFSVEKGQIIFDETITDKELEHFNQLFDKVNETLSSLEELESRSAKATKEAQERLRGLK